MDRDTRARPAAGLGVAKRCDTSRHAAVAITTITAIANAIVVRRIGFEVVLLNLKEPALRMILSINPTPKAEPAGFLKLRREPR